MLYRAIVTVGFCDTLTGPGVDNKYFSGTGEGWSKSIAKAVKHAERVAEQSSKGSYATPILRIVSVVEANTGKVILRDW